MIPRKTVAQKERVINAIRLRKMGYAYEQIAAQLGWKSRQAAYAAIKAALQADQHEAVEEMRTLEGLRIDDLQKAIYASALKGDLAAQDRVRHLMERRARLFGLDAPTQVEHSGHIDVTQLGDDELRAIVEASRGSGT